MFLPLQAVRLIAATVGISIIVLGLAASPECSAAPPSENLSNLSLEELSNLEVTSVSKSPEPLNSAPSAIFVITHDDIIRSGVTTITEALRLAPNLRLTQLSATHTTASARGFGGAEEAQNFSNKLLILIDGRSVYTPLYSGVYLDAQDLLLDDVERIEVISGPGATLWGANAMNGVINIITRPAYLTDRPLLSIGAGNRDRIVNGRYAGKVGERWSYRVYGKGFKREAEAQANGSSAFDAWDKGQGGFRADWTGAADSVTTQGDIYRAYESQPSAPDGQVQGGNLLSRWQHRTAAGEWQVQGYYDYNARTQPNGGSGFALRTFDLELQDSLRRSWNHIVWGAGVRLHRYHITNAIGATSLLFAPDDRSLVLGNLFLQDTVDLPHEVDLTLGLKLERDPYTDWVPLPDLRLVWRANKSNSLWASAARAVRSVTPFDHDVIEKLGPTVFLTGNPSFKAETVDAFELGYRGEPLEKLSLSASLFYDIYDNLRSIEAHSSSQFLPLNWGNLMRGHTYGAEAWATWQATDWWRLSPGLQVLRKGLAYKPGASQLLGVAESGDDPHSQVLLKSAVDLGQNVTFDTTFRYVGTLPAPHLPAYVELQTSIDGRISRHLDVSVSGFNLLHDRHQEYPSPNGEFIRRSILAQARWVF